MPLVRVPAQFFDALVDHASGLRGHLCLRALLPALFKRPRNRSRLLSCVFLGLLLLFQIQFGLTIVGLIWWSIPSWDNPATNDFENNSLLTPPRVDPTPEACDHIIALAASPLGYIPLFDEPGSTRDLALSSRITRSPPAA